MYLTRSKLYAILLAACLIGYLWLSYNLVALRAAREAVDVCLFKRITHIPCPSCGSTRAVLSLIQGDFLQALYINPFGIIIAIIMMVTPVWILFDLITKKKSLLDFYSLLESWLKKPGIAIPLILVTLINWIWNIIKAL